MNPICSMGVALRKTNYDKYMQTPKGKEARRTASAKYRKQVGRDIPNAKRREYRAKQKVMINMIKIERGCTDCGYNDNAYGLQFDHMRDKEFAISNKCGQVSDERMLREIAKCEVRCATCHMVKTARERGLIE